MLWTPKGADCNSTRLLYIHGGSFYYNSPVTGGYGPLGSKLAALTGAVVLVPDYPLAPAGNFITIQKHVRKALKWLAEEALSCPLGASPPLVVAGDSAGGTIALSLTLDLAVHPQEGDPKLDGAVFLSPWADMLCNTPDYYFNAFRKINHSAPANAKGPPQLPAVPGDIRFKGAPLQNSYDFRENAREYLGNDTLLTDPIASPMFAGHDEYTTGKVPPLYFVVGGQESIKGDSVVPANKAAFYGVDVRLDIYEGMWHVFPMYSEGCGSGEPLWAGKHALDRIADFIKGVTHDGPRSGAARGRPRVEVLYADPAATPGFGVEEARKFSGFIPVGRKFEVFGLPMPQALALSPASASWGGGALVVASLAAGLVYGRAKRQVEEGARLRVRLREEDARLANEDNVKTDGYVDGNDVSVQEA